jgi:ribosomal protein L29
MKKNDVVELRSKTHDELSRMLMDLRNETQVMNMEEIKGRARNTNAIRNKKKDIARVLTFMKIKEIVAVNAAPKEVKNNG